MNSLNRANISTCTTVSADIRIYFIDVTLPASPAAPSTPRSYALTTSVTFAWPAVSDPDGGISGYHVMIGTSLGGSNIFNALICRVPVASEWLT